MSFVLTFVASSPEKPVTETFISDCLRALRRYDTVQTCAPVWLSPKKAVEIGISNYPSDEAFSDLRNKADFEEIDFLVVVLENRRKRLLIADMESTIIKNEMLDELAEYAGVQQQVAEITARAMEGEIDFHSAIRERVGLLKGLSSDLLNETFEKLEYNEGAHKMIQTMRNYGCQCILVSGGFTFYTSRVARALGFDYDHANDLEIKGGIITGKVLDPILDKHAKFDYLRHYMSKLGIQKDSVMAIGDGANDLLMLKEAGLGVGYKPKDAVAREVHNIIRHGDFTVALYAQGFNDYHLT